MIQAIAAPAVCLFPTWERGYGMGGISERLVDGQLHFVPGAKRISRSFHLHVVREFAAILGQLAHDLRM